MNLSNLVHMMKPIYILLFLFSFAFVMKESTALTCNYNNDATSDEEKCSLSAEDNTKICIYDNEISGDNKCLLKTKCGEKDASQNSDCEGDDIYLDDEQKKKCVFKEGNSKCLVKTKCEEIDASQTSDCEGEDIYLEDEEKTQCVFEEGKSKCSVIEKCLLATSDCESYQVINKSSEKCVSKEGGGCMKKKYCDKIVTNNEADCTNGLVKKGSTYNCVLSDDSSNCVEKEECSRVSIPNQANCNAAYLVNNKMKCIYDETENKCKSANRECAEIIRGATKEICNSITVAANSKCEINRAGTACEVINNTNPSNSLESTNPTATPTTTAKTDEKNDSRFLQCSLVLANLLLML